MIGRKEGGTLDASRPLEKKGGSLSGRGEGSELKRHGRERKKLDKKVNSRIRKHSGERGGGRQVCLSCVQGGNCYQSFR